MSSRLSLKPWNRSEEDTGLGPEGVQAGASTIREARLGADERLELEARELRPGSEYEEATWRKTAKEGLDDIRRSVDRLTGRGPASVTGGSTGPRGRTRTTTTTRKATSRTSTTASERLPPGLRSRIHDDFGPLAYVRLAYSTKEHHICRVGLRRDDGIVDTILVVGPDSIREVDSVLSAIDDLPAKISPRRVAGDPFGDVHPVIDVEGIGEVYSERLAEVGIEDTRQLWHAATDDLAEALDVSPKVVGKWQAMAELIAINGIGPQYAELLVRAGITSIDELAGASAEDVLATIESTQEGMKVQIQGNTITAPRIEGWIEAAKEHGDGGE